MNMEKRLDKDQKIKIINDNYKHPHTYVNCDVRYFNFDFLVDKLGHFDGKQNGWHNRDRLDQYNLYEETYIFLNENWKEYLV